MPENKKRTLTVVCVAIAAAVLCISFIAVRMDRTVRLRSDSAGVEFITEGDTVTRVEIGGSFPYLSVVPKSVTEEVRDEDGNLVEEISTYVIEAEMSWSKALSMKLDLEVSDTMDHTCVLKFADRDVVIKNGKIVE